MMDEDLKPLFDKLTRLQKGVCLGVLEGKVQTQAYYEAGGLAKNDESARAITSRMLTDAKVKAFMDAADEKAVSSRIMTKQQAMERLSVLANSNVHELVDFSTVELETADGHVRQSVLALKDQANLDEDKLSMIAELSATKDGFKFKTHSPTQAIAQLSKMAGWDAPTKVAATDTEGNDVESDLMAIARKMLFTLDLASRTQDSNSNDKEGD